MMAFALVEVVMIVVGIVMANQLEEQKALREITESAEVLFEEVMSNLEAEVLSANAVIQRTARTTKSLMWFTILKPPPRRPFKMPWVCISWFGFTTSLN